MKPLTDEELGRIISCAQASLQAIGDVNAAMVAVNNSLAMSIKCQAEFLRELRRNIFFEETH